MSDDKPEGSTNTGPIPIQYADLEFEMDLLLEEMNNRLVEKSDEHSGWRDCNPEYLAELSDDQLQDFLDAVAEGDIDEAREQAGDTVNFFLMALSQMEADHEQ